MTYGSLKAALDMRYFDIYTDHEYSLSVCVPYLTEHSLYRQVTGTENNDCLYSLYVKHCMSGAALTHINALPERACRTKALQIVQIDIIIKGYTKYTCNA